MTFEFRRARFHLRAVDPLFFAPGKSANILRGAFGTVLDEPDRARIFAPRAPRAPRGGAAPSGLADPPRPFVFRAAHLDGARIAPGEPFHFDVNLFDLRDSALACFERAFDTAARAGIGPGRGRAELARVEELPSPAIRLDAGEPACAALVRFMTPTELKDRGGLADQPAFPVLFARLRDRISTLRALYGPGPLEIDFRGMAERAAAVRMARCDVRHVSAGRRSSRTGESHPLGGFVGEALYEGALGEFLPYLRAGEFTGAGRQTVWGKGELRVAAPATV